MSKRWFEDWERKRDEELERNRDRESSGNPIPATTNVVIESPQSEDSKKENRSASVPSDQVKIETQVKPVQPTPKVKKVEEPYRISRQPNGQLTFSVFPLVPKKYADEEKKNNEEKPNAVEIDKPEEDIFDENE